MYLKFSNALKDVEIVTNNDHFHIADKCKYKRVKKDKRRKLHNLSIEQNHLQGLYFDGRKDNILVIENVNQKTF